MKKSIVTTSLFVVACVSLLASCGYSDLATLSNTAYLEEAVTAQQFDLGALGRYYRSPGTPSFVHRVETLNCAEADENGTTHLVLSTGYPGTVYENFDLRWYEKPEGGYFYSWLDIYGPYVEMVEPEAGWATPMQTRIAPWEDGRWISSGTNIDGTHLEKVTYAIRFRIDNVSRFSYLELWGDYYANRSVTGVILNGKPLNLGTGPLTCYDDCYSGEPTHINWLVFDPQEEPFISGVNELSFTVENRGFHNPYIIPVPEEISPVPGFDASLVLEGGC